MARMPRSRTIYRPTGTRDPLLTEKRRIGARFARIAADEFVTPEHPKVTRLCAGSTTMRRSET